MSRIIKCIKKEEFDKILDQYKDCMAVRLVGLSYGSIIYFLMNTTLLEREDMFELVLWGWYWRLFKNNVEICNSKTITREFAESDLCEAMRDKKLEAANIEKNICSIYFSGDFRIVIEQKPHEEDAKDLFFLSLPDSQKSIILLTNDSPPQFKIDCDV